MRKAEQELIADYTARAQKMGVVVVRHYKEDGLNRMIVWRRKDEDEERVSNLTRFGDLISKEEDRLLREAYFANGGEIHTAPPGAGSGVRAPRGSTGKKAGRKAEPISTGDAKFDMYLNALPEPVRVLVVPLGWDPRELYKEYRVLKKDGLIAKYATDDNRAAAQEKAA